jgi:hypothetical protein
MFAADVNRTKRPLPCQPGRTIQTNILQDPHILSPQTETINIFSKRK